MSNAILNWRFGAVHFKILRDWPFVTITHNYAHEKHRRPKDWRWFEMY